MSRRRKSTVLIESSTQTNPKDRKAEDDTTKMKDAKTEWSEEEKRRLLDALKKDEGNNNWRWIARQVKTRTIAQVKEYASKLETEKKASNKRVIAPKDDSALEGWINVTKRLRGNDNVDGTCIPQNQQSRTQECTDSPEKAEADACNDHVDQSHNRSHGEDKEDQQDPPTDNVDQNQGGGASLRTAHSDEVHRTDALIENLLTNQKQMMEKMSVMDSKLEKLHTDDVSSQSTVIELLTKINEKLDQLGKDSCRSCCGGSVIIQTTPHAKVVHQPILDSCGSCTDSKKEKTRECLASFPSENNTCVTSRERTDPVSATPSNEVSKRTLADLENAFDKIVSRNQPSVILVSDSQNESSPKPGVTSSLSSLPVLKNKQDSSVMKVSCESDSKANGAFCSNQSQPTIREQSLKGDGCNTVVREGNSLPNGISSVASILVDQPPVSTTASTASLLREVTTVLSQLRHGSAQAECSKTLSSSPQKLTLSCTQAGTSRPVQMQLEPASLQHSPYIDCQKGPVINLADKNGVHETGQKEVVEIEPHHQRPPTVCPVSLTTVTGGAGRQYLPVGMLSGPSRHLPKPGILLANNSGAQSTDHQQPPRTPALSQQSLSQGYVTVVTPSHNGVTNVTPSPSEAHVTPTLMPQTVTTPDASPSTQQGTKHCVSPAADATIQRTDDGKSTPSNVSRKDLLSAAMLINNYVLEHPNHENQTQWQACLNAIVADYQKNNSDSSRGDLLQLVSIGHNPYVLLTKYELEDALEKSKRRPKFYALRLAEKLFGLDVLIKSTPYGIGGKAALNPVILDAIKLDVLQRFASDMSNEEKRNLWKGCVTSIAQRCKRARNPQRKRPSIRIRRKEENGGGLPSMAVSSDVQYDEHEDSHADSDEDYDECDDMDTLDQPSSSHTPATVKILSDSEHEEPQKSSSLDVLPGSDRSGTHHLKETQDSRVRSKSLGNSREGQEEDIHVPPGIDPDITVVHLPSAVKVLSKQADQSLSPGQLQKSSLASSDSESSPDARPEGIDNHGAYTVRVHETYEHEKDGDSPGKNVAVAQKYQGDAPPVVGSIYKPGPAATESVIVSGIRMTPDFSYVLVGGNPNVTLPRQKYLDCLTRSGQPTHFAVRLAEITFGDDVLKASTVTGGKRGTLQLDPNVIDAIQNEVSERFLKEVSKEQRTAVLRKCITSIATRSAQTRVTQHCDGEPCMILAQAAAKETMLYRDQHPQLQPAEIMTIAAMEPTQNVAGNETPDYSQIYTLLSRIMRGQPPPDLTPLDARVILDLLSDLEQRLAGHDVSSQVNFVTNKYKEVMGNQDTATLSTQIQPPARCGQANATNNSSDPGSSSSKPRTPLFSLNPLNVPVQLLNLKKPAPVSNSQL